MPFIIQRCRHLSDVLLSERSLTFPNQTQVMSYFIDFVRTVNISSASSNSEMGNVDTMDIFRELVENASKKAVKAASPLFGVALCSAFPRNPPNMALLLNYLWVGDDVSRPLPFEQAPPAPVQPTHDL